MENHAEIQSVVMEHVKKFLTNSILDKYYSLESKRGGVVATLGYLPEDVAEQYAKDRDRLIEDFAATLPPSGEASTAETAASELSKADYEKILKDASTEYFNKVIAELDERLSWTMNEIESRKLDLQALNRSSTPFAMEYRWKHTSFIEILEAQKDGFFAKRARAMIERKINLAQVKFTRDELAEIARSEIRFSRAMIVMHKVRIKQIDAKKWKKATEEDREKRRESNAEIAIYQKKLKESESGLEKILDQEE